MKWNLLALIALAPAVAGAQSAPFSITGKIGNLGKPCKVYIDYMDNGQGKEDSADVVNGVFTIKGTVAGIVSSRMSLDHEGKGKPFSIYSPDADVVYFDFGQENMQFTSADSIINAKVTGSKVYDAFVAYNKEIGGSFIEMIRKHNAIYKEASPEDKKDPAFIEALNKDMEEARRTHAENQLAFAKAHPTSYFALEALVDAAGYKMDVAVIEPLFNALSDDLKNLDNGKAMAQRIASVRLVATGKPAPTFTQNDINGNPLALSSLKGKVVLLDFWASWCSPCRAENPNMLKQYKLYKDKGFEILSVSLDSDKKPWLQAIEKDGLPWLHVSDLKGWNNEVGRLYGVRGVPACYLIDTEGNIIATDVRGEKLNAKLAEIFANK
ncbi:peroxiredoxin [Filimonas zeae]|uniref:Thiol:disulfide interchange protein n=1 Tax=Filimonas zeae TaxID=1737353 RepID=A0A917J0B0_9BACT|nr:TlpA disulfide reductase family protein [Filimonas zeae]MDR6340606.1 peroxiredoxin [Filimonas zeae]GGH73522.1 thiol:disulfide interchange protein [Filimonas zeae]